MRKIWKVIAISSASLVVVGVTAYELWQIHNLSIALAGERWSKVTTDLNAQDSFDPTVGNIQFIKGKTFSIELQKVDYNANGMHLQGRIGNATNLYLYNLTLTFTATKPIYKMREDYDKLDENERSMFGFFGSPKIGSAQSPAIFSLAPGTTASFEVTIPNARQTTDSIRIAVDFSGERYSYTP